MRSSRKMMRGALVSLVPVLLAACSDSDGVRPIDDAPAPCFNYGNTVQWVGPVRSYGGVVIPGISIYGCGAGYLLTDASQRGKVMAIASYRPSHVALAGHFAYIANWRWLIVYDVSTPSYAVELGSVEMPLAMGDIAATNSFAYVIVGMFDEYGTATQAGVQVLDVSSPGAPVRRGKIAWDEPEHWIDESASGICIDGRYAYVAVGNHLHIIDISAPDAPAIVGRLAVSASGIAVVGPHAYVVSGAGLHVVDVAVPATPVVVGTVVGGSGGSVVVDGTRAFVIDHGSLKVFDLSDPEAPQLVGTASVWPGAIDLEVTGAHVFVSSNEWWDEYEGPRGLQVVDVPEEISAPVALGGLQSKGSVVGANGPLAYTLAGGYGTEAPIFRVIDASSVSAPREIGQRVLSQRPGSIVFKGSTAFVSSGDGVEIIDASDPTRPRIASRIGTGVQLRSLAVHGDNLYLLIQSELLVFDVSSIDAPAFVRAVTTSRTANCLLEGMDQLLVGSVDDYGEASLTVFDLSEPADPMITYHAPEWCWALRDMVLANSYLCTLYSHEEDHTMHVYDVSARVEPIHVGQVEIYDAWGIAGTDDGHVFLSDGSIVDVSMPGRFRLSGKLPREGGVVAGPNGLYVSSQGSFEIFPDPCR